MIKSGKNDIIVRKAEDAETGRLRELFEKVFAETFSSDTPIFEEATEGEQLYAAFLGERLAGLASIWEQDAFVHFLFVDKGARHKGVASALIQLLSSAYDQPLTLKCLLENESAMAFYRATGWKEIEKGDSDDGPYALLEYPHQPEKPITTGFNGI